MRPRSDAGEELRATFSVAGAWPGFTVTFESGDGRGRNSDYAEGLRIVLERLGGAGAVLERTAIASDRVLKAAADSGLDPAFAPGGFGLPLALEGLDYDRLRRAIVNAGSFVNSPPGASGNTSRKLSLTVSLPPPALDAPALEALLAGHRSAPPLAMLTDLARLDAAMARWIGALEAGAALAKSQIRRLPDEAVVFRVRASGARAGARDVVFGVRTSGEPWTVELNAPAAAADANGLTTVAADPDGRLYLLRQGRLRPNPDSDGEIRGERFRELTGLKPVRVTGGSTPTPREWFPVAPLDGPDEMIREATATFVHACARARALSKGKAGAPGAVAPLTAPDEKGGWFATKPVQAKPGRDIRRLQGEIWLALRAELEDAGLQLIKLRHPAGYEIDGSVPGVPGVLIEIKTAASAADVYEGVGQLMLYGQLFNLTALDRLLLLPGPPGADLTAAAAACGVAVHTCTVTPAGPDLRISFSDAFLKACGAPGTGG